MPVLLDRMNVRFEDLLKRVGLPLIPLDHHNDLLPLRDVLAVVEGAGRATGIEHFGMLLATAAGLDAIGDYGRYIKAAPTLLEAIRRASHYISWQTLGVRLSLTAEGEACVWRFHLTPAVRADRQHAYLFGLVNMRDIIRLAAGPHWFPREVRLEGVGHVGHSRRLEETFGERITWGTGENALVFGQGLLALPLSWMQGSRSRGIAVDAVIALEFGHATTGIHRFIAAVDPVVPPRRLPPRSSVGPRQRASPAQLPARSDTGRLELFRSGRSGPLRNGDRDDGGSRRPPHRHQSGDRLLGGAELYARLQAMDRTIARAL